MTGFEGSPRLARISQRYARVTDNDMTISWFGNGGAGIIPDTFLTFADRIGIGMTERGDRLRPFPACIAADAGFRERNP